MARKKKSKLLPRLKPVLQALSAAAIMGAIFITLIEGISYLTNSNGLFVKHRPLLQPGNCAMWDASNEFKKSYYMIRITTVGKTHYLYEEFYLIGNKKENRHFAEQRSSSISYVDNTYKKTDCSAAVDLMFSQLPEGGSDE